jgi:hypothetical protein
MSEAAPSDKDAAAAWAARADDLAGWAWERLVNRTDAWGGYYRARNDAGGWVTYQMTRPKKANRGRLQLTRAVLARHFAATSTRDVAGLHTTSPGNACRWGALDIDRHGDGGPAPETTLAAALHWFDRLCRLGFRPLLTESNGKGGYHLRVVFLGPAPSARVFSLMRWLAADHAALGLAAPPECFPKQPSVAPPGQSGQYGNWLRLPGRHHTRAYWGRVWDSERWLGDGRAIDYSLGLRGDDPGLIPAGLPPPRPLPRPVSPGKRVWASPAAGGSLSARISAYVARLPHRAEGQGRDDVAYNLAAFLGRDLALSDETALAWLDRWDQGNSPPKGAGRLREILADAHKYGKRPLGCGRNDGTIFAEI